MKKAKNNLRSIFLMLLITAIAVPLVFGTAMTFADEEPETQPAPVFSFGDYDYQINKDGSATLVEYKGDSDVIEVPLEIDGHPVSAIGYQAFTYKKMKSLTIPEGIPVIGIRAFEYCDITDSLTLPRDIEIQNDAFAYAVLPPVVTIPEGATVGQDAFAYCEKMEVLFVEPQAVISKKAFSYSEDLDTLVCASQVKLENRAFEYSRALEQVFLCGDVETGDDTFSYCSDYLTIINAEEDDYELLTADVPEPETGKTQTGTDELTEYSVGKLTFSAPSDLESSKMPGYNLWLTDNDDFWLMGAAAYPGTVLDFEDDETVEIMTAAADAYVDVDYVDKVTVCGYPGIWMDIHTKEDDFSGVYLYISTDTGLYHLLFLDFGNNQMKFTDIVNTIVIE